MPYLTCDTIGEVIWFDLPVREISDEEFAPGYWTPNICCDNQSIILLKGSIKKLIGRDLTWEDEPFELK